MVSFQITQGCSTPAPLMSRLKLLAVILAPILGLIAYFIMIHCSVSKEIKIATFGIFALYLTVMTYYSVKTGLFSKLLRNCKWESKYDTLVEKYQKEQDPAQAAISAERDVLAMMQEEETLKIQKIQQRKAEKAKAIQMKKDAKLAAAAKKKA